MRNSVDAAHAAILKEKSGDPNGVILLNLNVDLSLLLPCQKTLNQHSGRTYYQAGISKAASKPQSIVPQVAAGRQRTIIDGKFQPLWFQGSLIPPHVAVEEDDMT